MVGYIRKVKTASGATAVQIAEKRGGVRRIVEHIGSAHSEADLAVLMQTARDPLNQGQQMFDLNLGGGGAATPVPCVSVRVALSGFDQSTLGGSGRS